MSKSDRPTDKPAEYSEVFTIIPPISVKGNTWHDHSHDPIKKSSQMVELYDRWMDLYHGLEDEQRFTILEMHDVFLDLSLSQKNIILKLMEEFYKINNLRK